ncbi:telomere repeat-binding protein 4-like [Malania oleifera]|uniref:telomere repeat-binding protein 4-like n=1 Tax=Malania oleifera TaxID=397392 RepID=UPI0025AE9234|nr:telomere repeat-binding protein 4-like [Malania oleifera]XP_057978953.1 telomere repeat-binding protein 4-like [Malania oleifera]
MGLKKAIYYGFSGYRAPTIPRAPRSIRKRGSQKKIVENTKISAFELLATVAGELLQGSESSSASSSAAAVNDQFAFGRNAVKQEQEVVNKPVKTESVDEESFKEKAFMYGIASQVCNRRYTLKEFPYGKSDAVMECISVITSSPCLEKISGDMKLENVQGRNASGTVPNNIVRGSLCHGESHDSNIEYGVEIQVESDGEETGGLTVANACSSLPTLVNSDSNVGLAFSKHPIPSASFSRHRNDVNLGNKDDDENFSRRHQLGTKIKAFKPPLCIGDRRIRKLLKSKYWKVAPKLKDCGASNGDGGIKSVYRKRKTCYTHRKSQVDGYLKRKKLSEQSSILTSDGGSSVESFANSPEKGVNADNGGPTEIIRGVGVSSSVMGHQASFCSGESHVKFSIKSFMVPELLIEVPETATVGLLKTTVMEAVTAMLGGGLRVGVLRRGKKIRDDDRTLLQTGISHKDNLDALGFALEPGHALASPLLLPEEPPFSPSCHAPQLLTSSSAIPISDARLSDVSPDPPLAKTLGNYVESNHDSLPSPSNLLTDKTMPDSRALVAVLPVNMDALAVAPLKQKTRRLELSQRRIRRPFSVPEVEALVQAVEELGTGRWRDVKLRAFENANHRTYVDLKDKWKTLVHTARISPQQRRGEPVPQQLLDRVLGAHAYWSQPQDKQPAKHHSGTPKITGAQAGTAEA